MRSSHVNSKYSKYPLYYPWIMAKFLWKCYKIAARWISPYVWFNYISDCHKLFIDKFPEPKKCSELAKALEQPSRQQYSSEDEPVSQLLQSSIVSSTEKSYSYKTRYAIKKKLFSESVDEIKESNFNNFNLASSASTSSAITSSMDQQSISPSEPIVSSEDEYVPDSADEATSSSDSNSSFVIPKVPQIVVDLSKNKRFYDRDDSKESFRQQNNNKQGSYSQNMSVENINNQYFQEIFPNNESVQIDQNLIIEVRYFILV